MSFGFSRASLRLEKAEAAQYGSEAATTELSLCDDDDRGAPVAVVWLEWQLQWQRRQSATAANCLPHHAASMLRLP